MGAQGIQSVGAARQRTADARQSRAHGARRTAEAAPEGGRLRARRQAVSRRAACVAVAAGLLLAPSSLFAQVPAAGPAVNAAVLRRIQAERTRLTGAITDTTFKLRTDEANGAGRDTLDRDRAAQQQAV